MQDQSIPHGYRVAYLEDPKTGCWVWQLARNQDGYGLCKREGKSRSAPRWYYEQIKGSINDGLELDHLCRNRACVNPDHLEPVTHTENVQRGLKAKLTKELASEVRSLCEQGWIKSDIGRAYGITNTSVGYIARGLTWAV